MRRGVLAKACKPGQERRVDLPTMGPTTIRRAAEAGLAGIAAEAGLTLVLERDLVRSIADELGLFVVGIDARVSRPCVMLVAAEPSGDALGASLADALLARSDVRLIGVGGPLMAQRGIVSPFDISPLSVLGIVDALAAYPHVRKRAQDVGEYAARERPDAGRADRFLGFQPARRAPPFAGRARQACVSSNMSGPKCGPRARAAPGPWRERSITCSRSTVSMRRGSKGPDSATTFVGNPVLAACPARSDPDRIRGLIGASPDDPLLVIAPGSRRGEVERLMGPFEQAAQILAADRPQLKFVVLAADAVADLVSARVAAWRVATPTIIGEAGRSDAMAAATAALACSGTITTEFALAGAPVVVAYRLDRPTALIAKLLIRTPISH